MKKSLTIIAVVLSAFSFSSCGLGSGSSLLGSSTNSSTASSIGSSLLSNALTSSGSSTGGVLTNVLSSLLGTKTTASSIVGTWTYSSPKVLFESEKVLAQLGSSVVSSTIEKKLGTQLSKIGFKEGVSSMTFNSDGSCTLSLSSKTMSGTYTYDSSTNVMTVKGALGVTSISPTVSVSGSQMYMVFDADKILSLVTNMAGKSSSTSSLSSLLGNYNGLKLGWTMTK